MRKIFSTILALCMVLSLVQPVTNAEGAEVVASGFWGVAENGQGTGTESEIVRDKFMWSLDSEGTFTFTAQSEDADEIGNQQNPANNPWGNYKDQIKKVVIPEGVVQVGGRLFEWYNTALTEAVLPESCEELMGAFVGCQQLKKINIPKNIKSLKLSYTGIDGSINIPATVETIRTEDFQGTSLSEVTINGSDVEADAFVNCQGMKTINVYGDSVVSAYAFHNNIQVSKIVLGPDVEFSDYAIAAWTDKVDGVFPEVTEIPGNVKYATVYGVKGTDAERYAAKHGLNFVPFDGIGTVGEVSWSLSDSILTISGNGDMADYEQGAAPWSNLSSKIRTVSVGDGVTSIGDNAFFGLSNVKNAVIADTVASIGDNAFAGCGRLAAVRIPDAVINIGTNAFDSATSVCVGTSSAFANADGYKTFTAGENGCTGISADSNSSNISWAVYGGDTLVISGSGKMRNTWESDNPWAAYAGNLKTAVVDYGIIWVTQSLFGNSSYPAMETVVIADGVTQMRHAEINGCPNIVRYDISNKIDAVEHYITDGDKPHLKELHIPGTWKKERAANVNFASLTGLETLILDEGLNAITTDGSNEWQSFIRNASSLKTVTIPSSVTKIGSYTFSRLSRLETIEIINPETEISENAFFECNNQNVTVICTAGSKAETWAKNNGMKTETYIGKGTLENGVGWYIGADGVLEISGVGTTGDYTEENAAPWAEYSDKITGIYVENGIITIGAYAFAGLSKAVQATVGKGVANVGENAFAGCSDSFSIVCESDAVKAYADANGITVIIGGTLSTGVSWKIEGDVLTVYGEGEVPGTLWGDDGTAETPWKNTSAFSNEIRTIVVEEGVTRLPFGAFAACLGLKTVSLPTTLTVMGNLVFHRTGMLDFIEIPENVGTCEGNGYSLAFPGNIKRSVVLSKTFDKFDGLAGEKGRRAEDLTVFCYADSAAYADAVAEEMIVETIKASGNVEKIRWVVTNEGSLDIYGIGDLAELTQAPWSEYCSEIKNVYIEEGITGVGSGLFAGINNAYIELPDSVTSLSENAITAENSTVRVPVYVKTIADGAFSSTVTIWSYKNAYALEYAEAQDLNSEERKSLRILALGNSYTQDSTKYLWKLADECGAEEVIVGRLFHAGARLYEHWNAAQTGEGFYLYTEQVSPDVEYAKEGVSLEYGLKAQDWDIIVLQAWYPEACYGLNGGTVAGNGVEDEQWLDLLTGYLKANATNENVELGFNMIWSQERQLSETVTNSEGANNRSNDGDTLADWENIIYQTSEYIVDNEAYSYIIPVGTAIENARTSYLSGIRGTTDSDLLVGGLQRDSVHLNDIGKYIAAMTWLKVLKPDWNVTGTAFAPDVKYYNSEQVVIDADVMAVAKEAVDNAVYAWDEVTASAHPFRIMKYENGNITIAASNVVRRVWGEDNKKAAELIIAEYTDNGALVKFKPIDVEIEYDEDTSSETSTALSSEYTKNIIPDAGFVADSGNTVKVLLWDGLTTMEPLCKALVK